MKTPKWKESKRYSKDFERFWSACGSEFGSRGAKTLAYTQWKEMHDGFPSEFADFLIEKWTAQCDDKRRTRDDDGRAHVAPFQHLERWLRNRRWEDEPQTAAEGAKVIPFVNRLLTEEEIENG